MDPLNRKPPGPSVSRERLGPGALGEEGMGATC